MTRRSPRSRATISKALDRASLNGGRTLIVHRHRLSNLGFITGVAIEQQGGVAFAQANVLTGDDRPAVIPSLQSAMEPTRASLRALWPCSGSAAWWPMTNHEFLWQRVLMALEIRNAVPTGHLTALEIAGHADNQLRTHLVERRPRSLGAGFESRRSRRSSFVARISARWRSDVPLPVRNYCISRFHQISTFWRAQFVTDGSVCGLRGAI